MDKTWGWIVALPLVTGLLAGCSAESKKNHHAKRADKYFAAEQFAQAEIEYFNVLQLENTNIHAIHQLGLLYANNGRPIRAYPFLTRSIELNPEDLEARLKLAMINVSGGEPQKAREAASFILTKTPTNGAALQLLAEASQTPAEIKEAKEVLEKTKRQYGDSAGINLAVSALMFRERKPSEAESALKRAIALDPKSAQAHYALGLYFLTQTNFDGGTKELKTAADLSELRSPIRMKYADFLAKSGKPDEAKKMLTETTKSYPDYLPAWIGLAELAFAQKDYESAGKSVNEALARDRDFYDGLLLDGRLKIATGEIDKAVAQLERLVSVYGRSPVAHYYLGNAYLLKSDPTKAMGQFNEAVGLNPEYEDALLQQAMLNIRRNEVPTAINSLKAMIKRNPNLIQAYFVLASAYSAKGTLNDSLATYRQIASLVPQNPQAHLLMGMTFQQMKRNNDAREEFQKAFELAPDYLQAFELLVNVDLTEEKYSQAIQHIRTQMEKTPKSAELQTLLGKVYLAQNDLEKAEQTLQTANQLNPDLLSPYRLLAQLYTTSHKEQEALDKLAKILQKNPSDNAALLQTAMLHALLKNYAAARDAYEKLIAANPRSPLALNNLAMLYLEHFNQPDKAYDAAKKARELQPTDPSIADTLGWILYKRGDYPWALSLLQESATRLTSEPEVLFHLGMTHYMLGQEEQARDLLSRAAQSGKSFAGRNEIDERLAVLKIDPQNVPPETTETLEKMLDTHPDDPVALSRLATFYERNKAMDKALKLYERAVQKNPNNLPATVKLAELYTTEAHDAAKALQMAKAARNLAPNDPEIAHTLGRLVFQAGDYAWSLALLQESQRKQAKNPELLYDLGLSSCAVGKVAEAESNIRNALNISTDFSRAASAQRTLRLLSAYLHPETAAQSKDLIEETLRSNPDDLSALLAKATTQIHQNDAEGARGTFDLILKRYPLFTPATKPLAILYARPPDGDAQKAYDFAVKARAAYPEDSEVAKTLGILAYSRKDYGRAVQLLKETAAKRPDDSEVFYYLGLTQFQLKQKSDAQQALQKALALKLDAKSAQEANRVLLELK